MAKGSSTRADPSRKRRVTGRNLGRAPRTQAGHACPNRRRSATNRDAVPACSPGVDASRPRLGPAPVHAISRSGPQRGPVRGRRHVPTQRNPCRVRGSPDRGAFDAPGKHSLRSASLGCMPQARQACSVTARRPTLPPFVTFVRFVVPHSTGDSGVTAPVYSRSHGAGAAAPYRFHLRALRVLRARSA
jgi:hypothetical protein